MSLVEMKPDASKPKSAPGPSLQADPRWQLVERILQSLPFQKSANLHALFSYLAEHSIQGKAESLTERQIGIAVFGKPADYSPADDSAVRVHVRQLRLRIHEYFAQEGRHEALRVDIPKGSYGIEFHEAEQEATTRPASPPRPAEEPAQPRKSRARDFVFWAAVVAAVVCSAGWYRAARVSAHPSVPWPLNAVISNSRPTRIVVSDSSMMLRLMGDHEISLDEYLQPNFRQSRIPPNHAATFDRLLSYIADSQLTSFADLTAVSTLMKLAGPLNSQLVVTSARDLNRRDLEQGNYVFVGSPTSNPWVELFANQLNFQVVEESVGGRIYFLNRNPRPGELKQYEGLPTTGSTGEDYATISVFPGEMGQGNIMILQGLRQGGTEALAALLADPAGRAGLQRAVERNSKSASPYFEALIRSQAVAGAPVSVNIVAVRSIQP